MRRLCASVEAPGPDRFCTPRAQVSYRGEIDIEDVTAVAAWYRRFAEPDSILNWDAPSIGVSPAALN